MKTTKLKIYETKAVTKGKLIHNKEWKIRDQRPNALKVS